MSSEFKPPLAIYFIWNPSDAEAIEPILNEVRKCFARDKDRQFSRGLNIPLFFYSSQNPTDVPNHHPQVIASRNVVFVFTSVNTLGQKNWQIYVENLASSSEMSLVPVAIDYHGLSHAGALSKLNCIRFFDWPSENRVFYAIVSLAHEIYRYGFIDKMAGDNGSKSSITIFLSHTKEGGTGLLHAKAIKDFIDNTNMKHFFDATKISPGFLFDEEIEKYIPGSTLLAIESDAYSSRYWCQREILSAKRHNRPIVVVDCLEDYEDRIFPAVSNVPRVHVTSDDSLSEKNILRIIVATILETIRHDFVIQSLRFYQSQGWISKNCALTSRPPEIRQALSFKNEGKTEICYPEPPIYLDEADWHEQLGVNAFTPLWSVDDNNILKSMRIGISISEVTNDEFSSNYLHADQLIRLAQDTARHLLARSATLLYGGDLRKDGFTAFILDEAAILQDRLQVDQQHVENHLAWPLYVSSPEIIAWRAKYTNVMKTKEHLIPEDLKDSLSKDYFLPPITVKNKYIWSRCLTEMRNNSIGSSTVRICAGGKLSGYKGKMPGVLEEILIAIDMQKPIYLLGAYGGATGEVCNTIFDGIITEKLTENWQIEHNTGYQDLQKLACSLAHEANFVNIKVTLESVKIDELARKSGLNSDEYKRLMQSPFVDECVYLITKGLRQLAEELPE